MTQSQFGFIIFIICVYSFVSSLFLKEEVRVEARHVVMVDRSIKSGRPEGCRVSELPHTLARLFCRGSPFPPNSYNITSLKLLPLPCLTYLITNVSYFVYFLSSDKELDILFW